MRSAGPPPHHAPRSSPREGPSDRHPRLAGSGVRVGEAPLRPIEVALDSPPAGHGKGEHRHQLDPVGGQHGQRAAVIEGVEDVEHDHAPDEGVGEVHRVAVLPEGAQHAEPQPAHAASAGKGGKRHDTAEEEGDQAVARGLHPGVEDQRVHGIRRARPDATPPHQRDDQGPRDSKNPRRPGAQSFDADLALGEDRDGCTDRQGVDATGREHVGAEGRTPGEQPASARDRRQRDTGQTQPEESRPAEEPNRQGPDEIELLLDGQRPGQGE